MLASLDVGPETYFRFSLDSSLGRLARWLRLLGHDAAWGRGDTLSDALARARHEGRALLTRSRDLHRLGFRWPPGGGLVVRSELVDDQLFEIARRWPIFALAVPFSRCAECGVPLADLSPEEARSRVPEHVGLTQTSFRSCPRCGRIFWKATHAQRIVERLGRVAERAGQSFPLAGAEAKGARSEPTDPAPPQR